MSALLPEHHVKSAIDARLSIGVRAVFPADNLYESVSDEELDVC